MSIDKVSPPNTNNEVVADQNNNLVTPKTFEMMTEAEVEELMAERQRKQDRSEWCRTRFGDPRPLSEWDLLD